MQRFTQFILLLAVLAGAGCGNANPDKVALAPESTLKPTSSTQAAATRLEETAPTQSASQKAAEADSADLLAVTAPEGPAAASFQQTLVAFQGGRLDLAFEFLPASYQADLETIVHSFAEKTDAELWSQSFGLLGKLAQVMKTKKEMIFEFEPFKHLPQMISIKPHWDDLAAGLQELSKSEVANLDFLKSCEMKRLLSSANRLLTGIPLPKFGNMTVTTLKSDDQFATLTYRESKEGEPTQVEFVKIEGKWLPRSMVDGWSAGIADARKRVTQWSAQIAANKSTITQALESTGDSLERIRQAKNQEEFASAFFPLMLSVTTGSQIVQQAMLEASIQSRASNAVRIEIDRELMQDDQTKLKDAVLSKLGEAAVDYEMICGDGKTRCRFTPIPEPETLVSVLEKHFHGASVRLNSDTKTIHVEWK